MLYSCTALQRKVKKACLYCYTSGKVPSYILIEKINDLVYRKLKAESCSQKSKPVLQWYKAPEQDQSVSPTTSKPQTIMLLDPHAITEGRKVEQVSVLEYVLSLMP